MALSLGFGRLSRLFSAPEEQAYANEVDVALEEQAPIAARLLLWTLLALLIGGISWAYFAKLEEITRGEGKAIPSSKIQKIQNLEGGIVAEIFVREGQVVDAGQTLLRLDATRYVSNQYETEGDRMALLATVTRLRAEVNGVDLTFTDEFDAFPRIAADELALYQSRQARLQGEVRILEEQKRQKQQELAEFEAKSKQYRSSVGLLQRELNMSAPLVKSGAMSEVEILRLRRSLVDSQGQLDAARLAIPRAQSAIEEIERRIEDSRLSFRTDALRELNEARTELSKTTASMSAIDDRVSRTTVTSPVRGIVKQLLVNTIGGVVQPGSDLLEIVPLDDKLLVEAQIRPQDIAFLHPGQNAMVKFTAYDYTIYGGLKAHLEHISADTITDQEGNSFYLIRLRTERNHLGREDNPLLIIPGMVASVDIITGEKSVLDYLLKPVLKARSEAMRER
ncbi:HlyD family type I secretion periplasmic adaptor subunit [Atopomonas sediminilitoris]|uniref:HlyD family type I secretion periplasmic adaptor subunit n=1 Tax=Atopomonas sediminilitoris TaxID=2919919 RepID=UPI001F4D610B|nr:HlyD family type I secretion periplasmic adaptor subunit [Atopomonas sediminilitoris]MCJ8168820.1 HlyD family type I secretion periplasmic adaptor subunit [Atopomonas sediminilitoris]